MNRKIKFRAWDKHNNTMFWNIQTGIDFEDGSHYKFSHFLNDEGRWDIMQFVGLLDRTGREIYEGDVVHEPCSNPKVNWTYEVYYDEQNAKFWVRNEEGVLGQYNMADDPAYPSWENYEVIGNIYEHPHLLADKKKEAEV